MSADQLELRRQAKGKYEADVCDAFPVDERRVNAGRSAILDGVTELSEHYMEKEGPRIQLQDQASSSGGPPPTVSSVVARVLNAATGRHVKVGGRAYQKALERGTLSSNADGTRTIVADPAPAIKDVAGAAERVSTVGDVVIRETRSPLTGQWILVGGDAYQAVVAGGYTYLPNRGWAMTNEMRFIPLGGVIHQNTESSDWAKFQSRHIDAAQRQRPFYVSFMDGPKMRSCHVPRRADGRVDRSALDNAVAIIKQMEIPTYEFQRARAEYKEAGSAKEFYEGVSVLLPLTDVAQRAFIAAADDDGLCARRALVEWSRIKGRADDWSGLPDHCSKDQLLDRAIKNKCTLRIYTQNYSDEPLYELRSKSKASQGPICAMWYAHNHVFLLPGTKAPKRAPKTANIHNYTDVATFERYRDSIIRTTPTWDRIDADGLCGFSTPDDHHRLWFTPSHDDIDTCVNQWHDLELLWRQKVARRAARREVLDL